MIPLPVRLAVVAALVAAVPFVLARFGPAAVGPVVLFPATTLLGLYAVHAAGGSVPAAAWSALASVPAVGAFLLAAWVVSSWGAPVPVTLVAGLVAYAATCAAVVVWAPAGVVAAAALGAVVVRRRSNVQSVTNP